MPGELISGIPDHKKVDPRRSCDVDVVIGLSRTSASSRTAEGAGRHDTGCRRNRTPSAALSPADRPWKELAA
jgi:hypothetical protein